MGIHVKQLYQIGHQDTTSLYQGILVCTRTFQLWYRVLCWTPTALCFRVQGVGRGGIVYDELVLGYKEFVTGVLSLYQDVLVAPLGVLDSDLETREGGRQGFEAGRFPSYIKVYSLIYDSGSV